MKYFKFALLLILFSTISSLYAEETVEASFEFTNHTTNDNTYYNELNSVFQFNIPYLTIVANMSVLNDGKYQADKANLASGDLLGYYVLMNNGYLALDLYDFHLTVGQKEHSDIIESDYSLFVSGNQNPAFIADFVYDGDWFFYETRWTRLNERSANLLFGSADETWPDRGANLKTFAVKFNGFRIGFQDAAVYLDRSFDLEYFINPLPQYFIQYVKTGPGRPWKTESNENNLIGAFIDYSSENSYYYFQYLMDDFNLHWLLPDTPHNPNKMAYAAGGRIESEIGKFSFDAALAFKYTFQSTYAKKSYSDYPYEYTYYPSSTFIVDEYNETVSAIDYTDNYLGYKYGENNLALQIGWEDGFDINNSVFLDVHSALEYTVSGSKSPTNPWHELDWHTNEGTKFLDEEILEHRILSTAECRTSWKGFYGSLGFSLGYVFNELELTEVVAGEAPFFVPEADNDHWVYDVYLSLGYKFQF